jgi:hypothetical protein
MITRLRRGRPDSAHQTIPKIMLAEDVYSFVDEDGETVHGTGYRPIGDDGEPVFGFMRRDVDYAAHGVRACNVAGVSYRHHELQSDEFAPLGRLRLVPDPSNSYDGNAIEVRSSDGKLMVGFIPRETAAEMAPCFKRDGPWEAMSVWEWRTVSRGRIGIRVLMAPRLEVSVTTAVIRSNRSSQTTVSLITGGWRRSASTDGSGKRSKRMSMIPPDGSNRHACRMCGSAAIYDEMDFSAPAHGREGELACPVCGTVVVVRSDGTAGGIEPATPKALAAAR